MLVKKQHYVLCGNYNGDVYYPQDKIDEIISKILIKHGITNGLKNNFFEDEEKAEIIAKELSDEINKIVIKRMKEDFDEKCKQINDFKVFHVYKYEYNLIKEKTNG